MADFAAVPEHPLHYRAPSRFPTIDIDMSFAADLSALDYRAVSDAVRKAGGTLLSDLRVLDVYENENGQTITLRLTFSSPERTLAKAELSDATEAVAAAVKPLGMTFRAV